MPASLSQSSVAVYQRGLTALLGLIDKAVAHATAKKFDPAIYVTMRLRPDMFHFGRQVQATCDQAKNAAARLAGVDPPRFEDNETTLDELKARINKTLTYVGGLDASAIDLAADKEVMFPLGPNKVKMQGGDYLNHFSLPNFYFHLTTAYDILRYAGVDLAKRDFLGVVPGVSPT